MSVRSEIIRVLNEVLGNSKKISELDAATTPLSGTELIEIVQSGENKQVAVSDVGGGSGTVTSVSVVTANGVSGSVATATTTPAITLTVQASSETQSGIIEIATQAEVTTGTDDLRSVTPLKLAVATRGVQDLFLSAAANWPRTTGGCGDLTKYEMATSLVNIQGLPFDAITQEFAQIQIVLPRKYNLGTITAVPYWMATSGSGSVQWGVSGGAYSHDDALTVALGTAQTSDLTMTAANDLQISPATSAITLAGTPAAADLIVLQISRNPASDTLAVDAILIGVSVRVTVNAVIDA